MKSMIGISIRYEHTHYGKIAKIVHRAEKKKM